MRPTNHISISEHSLSDVHIPTSPMPHPDTPSQSPNDTLTTSSPTARTHTSTPFSTLFATKMQRLFVSVNNFHYLCSQNILKAFIDACFGIRNPANITFHPKQEDSRCLRDMYSSCPRGIHTYLRGLMLFILVVGSCRNLGLRIGKISTTPFCIPNSIA